jgi:glutathione synthase/RimK-type ligase-like ATP-grasp enzyme
VESTTQLPRSTNGFATESNKSPALIQESEAGVLNSSPKVLLADTNRWDLGARLAIGLARIGCTVSAVCPSNGHTLLVTRAVKRAFPYRASNPLESLRAAIEKSDPDIVVPCCDRSVEHLHQLYGNASKEGAAGEKIVRLIENSLGDPRGYRIVTSRYDLLSLAQEEGISVPETTRVSSSADLDLWRTSKSNACVVKVDGTWGGLGVRTLRELDPSERVWDEITKTSRLTRAIKRLMVNRDAFFMSAWMNHTERPIIAQKFIGGRPANCTVFAWKGKVIALIAVEVLRSDGSTGPASVVHLIQNAEIRKAAERIAVRLGISGFFGLDFILEESTGRAYLIEMNARLAPPCYLRFEKGRDLIGAMWASVSGQPIPDSVRVTESDIIAYQAQTLQKDDTPAGCYYPEPEDEPELVREMQNPFPNRTLLFRLVQLFDRIKLRSGRNASSGRHEPTLDA